MDPETFSGGLHVVLMGMAAALVALAVSVYFPSIIPAKATQVKL